MGVLQRVVGAVLGLAFLVAVFIFSALALGVLLALGLVGWAWLAWRTRSLRRSSESGSVIEGEYRDVSSSERLERRNPSAR